MHHIRGRVTRQAHVDLPRQRTDEQAVMIDTRRPLTMTDAAREASVADYWRSWMDGEEELT